MHEGKETDALRAICCPTTTFAVPEMLLPASWIVGAGAAGKATERGKALVDTLSNDGKLTVMLCDPAEQDTEYPA